MSHLVRSNDNSSEFKGKKLAEMSEREFRSILFKMIIDFKEG
jgi:hypothetical protein